MRRVFETIEKYHMIRPGMKILAAVSGGADSVCMLLVLEAYRRQVPFELEAVHVEHGIRGEESRADAAFVERLCSERGICCQVVSCDAPEAAGRLHMSLEEAARTLRYEILRKICREHGCDVIATAHHAMDQAETVLWNLARGTGAAGLAGIRPVSGDLIRPMLEITREEIEAILRDCAVTYRTDRTNADMAYTRNRIRGVLLPWMEQNLNRQTARHICRAAEHVRGLQDFADRMADEAEKNCIRQGRSGAGSPGTDAMELLLAPFAGLDPYLQGEVLRRCIARCRDGKGLKDIGAVHIQMLRDLVCMPCGKQVHLPGIRVCRESGKLVFSKIGAREKAEDRPQAHFPLFDPGTGQLVPEFSISPWLVKAAVKARQDVETDEIFREKTYTKFLSYDTITCNVCFRTRRPGDFLVVNAQGGRKKLGDYFTDRKVPAAQRDSLWLLADGSRILWIPGYRIGEDVKVTADTRQILVLELEPEPEDSGFRETVAEGTAHADGRSV